MFIIDILLAALVLFIFIRAQKTTTKKQIKNLLATASAVVAFYFLFIFASPWKDLVLSYVTQYSNLAFDFIPLPAVIENYFTGSYFIVRQLLVALVVLVVLYLIFRLIWAAFIHETKLETIHNSLVPTKHPLWKNLFVLVRVAAIVALFVAAYVYLEPISSINESFSWLIKTLQSQPAIKYVIDNIVIGIKDLIQ